MTNEELDTYIIKYRQGDKETFEILYNETINSVCVSIYKVLGSQENLEDLVQETYQKALQKIDSYKEGTSFKSWICTIAHNHAVNYIKNKGIKEIAVEPSMQNEVLFGSKSYKDNEDIKYAYDCLSEEEQHLFTHLIVEGLSIKETADLLGCNINRVYYLREKLKERLKEIFEK